MRFLVWIWERIAGSQSSTAWLQKGKEKREGFRCWWVLFVFCFLFLLASTIFYGGCLQNILGEISRSSFCCLSISLDRFQMNTNGLKDQTRPWFILCQCHLHKRPWWWSPLSTAWGLGQFFTKATLLIFLRFCFSFWWWSNCMAWFCPLKNSICISWEKAGESFTCCQAGPDPTPHTWQDFDIPGLQGRCLQGGMLLGVQVAELGPCNRNPCYFIIIIIIMR